MCVPPVVKILTGDSEWPLDVFGAASRPETLRWRVIGPLLLTTCEAQRDVFHWGNLQVMMSFIHPGCRQFAGKRGQLLAFAFDNTRVVPDIPHLAVSLLFFSL